MAGKIDFQELLMLHGEKIGAAVAGVGLLALMGWGGMLMASAEDSHGIKTKLDQLTSSVQQRTTNNPARPAPELPTWVDSGMKFPELHYADYRTDNPLFDILLRDDGKRRNPVVYGPSEFDVDLVRSVVKINDIMVPVNGRDGDIKIGVLVEKEIQKNDQSVINRRKQQVNRLRQTAQPQFNPNLTARGGMPVAGEGGVPGSGILGSQQMRDSRYKPVPSSETNIEYVSLDKFEKEAGKYRMAEVLLPVRMAVVTANFPYKQQFQELARALRYASLDEMLADQSVGLRFRGFNVMRQVRETLTGRILAKWQPYDWQAGLGAILAKSTEFQPEDPAVSMVVPPLDDELTAPLPKLAKGTYPPVKLKSILESVETLRTKIQSTQPVFQESQFTRKIKGENVVFGLPRGNDPMAPGGDPRQMQPMPGQPGAAQLPPSDTLPDHCLIRFVDTNVEPGYTYEYQIQVKIANPNYKRFDLVGRPSWAESEDLLGPWVQIPQPLVVSDEAYLYVTNDRMLPNRKPIPANGEVAMIEMQRWFESVSVTADDKRGEPVGDWVVARMPVNVGEFIGGREAIELPLWSPSAGGYVIREKAPPPRTNLFNPRAQVQATGGAQVNFATGSILVSLENGDGRYYNPRNPRLPPVDDEAGREMLVLTPDGKLWAYNSARQEDDEARKQRSEEWVKWVEEVKQLQLQLKQPGGATADPFAPR
jgi:hypothetical protein